MQITIQEDTRIPQEDGSVVVLEKNDIIQVIEAQSELAFPEQAKELSSYLPQEFSVDFTTQYQRYGTNGPRLEISLPHTDSYGKVSVQYTTGFLGEGWRINGGKLPTRKTLGPYSTLKKVADVLMNNKEMIFGKDPKSPSKEDIPEDYVKVYSSLQQEREIQNIVVDRSTTGRPMGLLFEWKSKQFHLTAFGTSKFTLKNITDKQKAQMINAVDFISDPISILRNF